ncbi:MAG: ABC transporter permease subunit [Rubrivivax sp.]|nr:ABC transporter permease subunit [Rubrivivax sp.]
MAANAAAVDGKPIVVGSKRFTESYILGEIVCGTLAAQGQPCTHRQGLGNTGILEQALAAGEVDLYPEYTGTIVRAILKREGAAAGNPTLAELNEWLAPRGLKAAVPLGFNNTYALAMPEAVAQRLGVAKVSDLARVPAGAVQPGLSHEFIVREDGWPALKRAYGLPFEAGNALDHGLAYDAVKAGRVNLIDAYSTDARIGRDGLRVLADDRAFFPRYDAVLLMRLTVDESLLLPLVRRIDEARMTALNAEAEIDGKPFAAVARGFLAAPPGAPAAAAASAGASAAPAAAPAGLWRRLFAPDLMRLTRQHLWLVFASVALAAAVAVPLGVLAWRRPRLAGWVLAVVGVLQTVPSLALLAVLIAVLGTIGFWPALLALFVYALLPIVANTHAGLAAVPVELSLAARALGLKPLQALRLVELPLALPTIVTGVKTAAVINVGTATVAAFVGAGGYGERIVAGLAVNDSAAMLAGAVPAALLALVVQGLFDRFEKRLRKVPA